ncbi:MAG: NfeD family protein [Ruminococcaceae bacterium]|nr:NfeD family protein [Oscillospiraceae bacterium]
MAALIWLILMVAFLFIEGNTVTMVSLWFGAGALAALIAALCGAQLWLQIVIFFVVSIALLAALRPLARKYFTPKLTATNVDGVIGSVGIVTADIDNIAAQGQVKLASMEWTARSSSGDPIPAGTQVRVDRIEGVKAFVSPVQVETPV